MTKLSVNINKLATLRNARGHNRPDILQAAHDIERFGAEGITVHHGPTSVTSATRMCATSNPSSPPS